MKITRKEYESITTEIGERLKDMMYERADKLVRAQLSKAEIEGFLDEPSTTTIQTVYEVTIMGGDLLQILGRQRRLKRQ